MGKNPESMKKRESKSGKQEHWLSGWERKSKTGIEQSKWELEGGKDMKSRERERKRKGRGGANKAIFVWGAERVEQSQGLGGVSQEYTDCIPAMWLWPHLIYSPAGNTLNPSLSTSSHQLVWNIFLYNYPVSKCYASKIVLLWPNTACQKTQLQTL